ncbi:B3 domain-containing protein At5g26805-like [Papaver somniferum]|uniref:B3 domain-containing protein At5g26805-like n=1 Tax=Papaver somniferum TaxID=3469 RepID=UPI000E6FFD42|nr:B3 domain-containing protein At5g26805-like [Papaver somniferum]
MKKTLFHHFIRSKEQQVNNVRLHPEIIEIREDWPVQTVLPQNDVDGSNGDALHLDGRLVNNHMLPYMKGSDRIELMDDSNGLRENMVLKSLSGSTYALKKNRISGFVRRRSLKAGEKIGIRWDNNYGCFVLNVLSRY